eukprot:gb/GEZJ01001910.1/.p2 GENE.gb/GEZJ01001910.1/~~gb/GEZJ01001910.1/.p2  ORF type:complete len:176 (-),score=15.24 gb/GEZJ01001910.1/:174-701(-)
MMEGLNQFVSGLYWQPFNPSTDTPLKDRYELALESIRPWGEFFNISEFNLPPFGQIKGRVQHNLEAFLYNYLVLVGIHIFFFALTHSGIALVMVLWFGLMYVMYFKFEGDIDVGEWTINARMKGIIAVVSGLLALFVGHVLTFVISLSVFVLITVGTHSLIRDSSSGELEVQEAI